MAEIRETEVERDAEGRVTHRTERVSERPRRRGGGFGWGLLLGVLIIAVGIIFFAYQRGSFEQAGLDADRAAVQAEGATRAAAADASQAAEKTLNQAESAVQRADNEANDRAQN